MITRELEDIGIMDNAHNVGARNLINTAEAWI